MIRTFGMGLRVRMPFCAFGMGENVGNVGKTWENVKTIHRRNVRFRTSLGPWMTISFQKTIFPMFLCIFIFSCTIFTMFPLHPFCSVSLCFCCIISTCSFPSSPHLPHTDTHTHTHTKHAFLQYSEHCHTTPHHTHATRDLQSVLSKSTSVNTPSFRYRRANHSLYLGQGRRTKD